MNSYDVPSNDLIADWSGVTLLVGEIRKLLDETLDADADARDDEVSFCHKSVSELVTILAAQLRSIFAKEESHGFLANLYQTAPQLSDGIARLKDERMHLLDILDEISELALRPEVSWDDTQDRFQRFMSKYTHHERSEDQLIQQASQDESGVID